MTDHRDKPKILSADEVLRGEGVDELFPAQPVSSRRDTAPNLDAAPTVSVRRMGLWILAGLVVAILAYLTL